MTISTRRLGHQLRLSPVQTAVARAAWRRDVVDTQIHALIGEDQTLIGEKAGSMVFIIACAARLAHWAPDHSDMQAMRAAIRSIADIQDEGLTPRVRWSIVEGIEALARMAPLIDINLIIMASVRLRDMHKAQDGVTLNEYESLFK